MLSHHSITYMHPVVKKTLQGVYYLLSSDLFTLYCTIHMVYTYLKLTVINCPVDVIGSDGAVDPHRP